MSEVVVSTRVRLARNLKNYPFVSRLSKEDRKKVVEEVREAFSHSDIRLNFIDMASLDKVQKLSLAERHIISPEFVEAGEGSALLISDDNTVAVMINEEDHIRLQVIKEGLSLKEAYETASYLDDVLSEHLELAFSERLGYLTQCPTNLGTAMRASVMLHLPALDDSGALSRIGVNLSKLGLVMRGLYGEGSKTYGAFSQLSNQVSLGISEEAAIENLENVTKQLISQEIRARDKILCDIAVEDKISRSLGILKSAYVIDHSEAMALLSNVRLGAASKKLITLSTESIDKLISEIQPASILLKYGEELSPRERDIKRAELLRERLN
ncbi:MAG: protein arginine kinase [Ruminococcus sp.]|nr:protein arginine kinase [Ruminococcus sp.]